MDKIKILELAEQIARKAHEGQFRKCGIIPYIEHPKAVVGLLDGDIHAQIVAWLHDIIEDCDINPDDLKQQGIPVRYIIEVILLTKNKNKAYDDYLKNIELSPLATKVKIADMISNLSDNPSEYQKKKYAKGLMRLIKNNN